MTQRPDTSDLTDLQLLILGALWAVGEATISQVHEAVDERASVSSKTIGVLLGRMEKRGIVSRDIVGREGVYRPLVTRKQVLVSRVGGALASVFAAEDDALGTAAVKRKHTHPDDAEELIELLRRAERDLKRK